MISSLSQKSTLPYGTPDFSSIRNEEFRTSLLEAMDSQTLSIKEIIENQDIPTIENTLLPLEKSNQELRRISNIFYALASAHTDKIIQSTENEILPLFATHQDNIYLNDSLFQRIKYLYNNRNSLNSDTETLRLLEYYYDNFTLYGANLSEEKKEELKKINAQLASLVNEFNFYTLEARKKASIIIHNEEELKGLSYEEKQALKQADGTWKIDIINTTQQPILASLENETTRKRVFDVAWNRASRGAYATENIILDIITLRKRKANLLSYKNYAEWSLQKSMAKNPETVWAFFDQMMPHTFEKVKEEAKILKENTLSEAIQPYDWNYYTEKIRKNNYNLDENELKPYFELFNVLEKGVFYATTLLYGITFKKRTDLPVYHPDVVVYELFEEDNTPLGLFYGDFYAREEKKGGAWMSCLVTPSKFFEQKPVVYNVCNYIKPKEGSPCLLTFSEVETLFHEFGHALHAFFAEQKYASLAGTAVARDFVEFPSQFNENWALHPIILKNYAVHYQTNKVIDDSLIKKMKDSRTFNQGYAFCEVLASAYLDMKWHTLSLDDSVEEVTLFEQTALEKFPKEVPPRYRSSYFSHIFGGGYAASYYAYQYSEMLARDAYQWFEENNGLTRENGEHFRKEILSKGNTMDYQTIYKAFSGRLPF